MDIPPTRSGLEDPHGRTRPLSFARGYPGDPVSPFEAPDPLPPDGRSPRGGTPGPPSVLDPEPKRGAGEVPPSAGVVRSG